MAFLLPTTLKRYCIQIFAARYFRELVRLAKFANLSGSRNSRTKGRVKKNGFYSISLTSFNCETVHVSSSRHCCVDLTVILSKKKFCRQDKTTCTFLLCDLVGHMVTAFESNYFLIVVSLVSKDMSSGQ